MIRTLRKWFIAGLLVWIPVSVTIVLIRFVISLLDAGLLLIPASYRPNIPVLGVFITLFLVMITGALAANFFGARVVRWAESLLDRIPIIRSVYGGMKKLAETVFADNSVSFRTPVLFEYPRKGLWSIGFQTGKPIGEIQQKTDQQVITVFVPTTPNPTSGWIVMVPIEEARFLDMSVEQAMRLIISLGVVTPDSPEIKRAVIEKDVILTEPPPVKVRKRRTKPKSE